MKYPTSLSLRCASARLSAIGLLVVAMTYSNEASAYNFIPERQEWASWSGYCKARYVTTDIGKRSQFRDDVAPTEVQYWRDAIGPEAFLHIHHYCAGLIWLERAKFGWNNSPKEFLLDRAVDESRYTYSNIGPDNPMATAVVSTLAIAFLEKGDQSAAESLIRELVAKQPTASEPYVMGAVIYHRVGNLNAALKLMESGVAQVEEPGAEFYYTLGLILADLERYSEAKNYADLAYGLGYPLPGLRLKLERQGIN